MQSTSPTDSGHYNFLYARYSGNDLLKFKKLRMENPQLTHARGESPTVAVQYGSSISSSQPMARGPFLESPANFSNPVANVKIRLKSKPVE